jgi:hypothetical protein
MSTGGGPNSIQPGKGGWFREHYVSIMYLAKEHVFGTLAQIDDHREIPKRRGVSHRSRRPELDVANAARRWLMLAASPFNLAGGLRGRVAAAVDA